jgi:hypothetical protein
LVTICASRSRSSSGYPVFPLTNVPDFIKEVVNWCGGVAPVLDAILKLASMRAVRKCRTRVTILNVGERVTEAVVNSDLFWSIHSGANQACAMKVLRAQHRILFQAGGIDASQVLLAYTHADVYRHRID